MRIPQFLMLLPFLKKLMTDTSAGSIHKACKLLEQNGIQYSIQTLRLRGSYGARMESGAYMRFNVSQRSWGSEQSTAYALYVRRKDYQKARTLTGSIELE